MSQIPSDALATLNALNQQWGDANPNTGGQEWPPPGVHKCLLQSVSFEKREKAKKDNDGNLHDANDLRFHYITSLEGDPTTGAEPRVLEFNGKPFRFFSDNSWMNENQAKYYLKNELNRLKGHLSKILNMDPQSLPPISDCLDEINKQLSSGAEIPLMVRITQDKGSDGGVFHSDFVQSNLNA